MHDIIYRWPAAVYTVVSAASANNIITIIIIM